MKDKELEALEKRLSDWQAKCGRIENIGPEGAVVVMVTARRQIALEALRVLPRLLEERKRLLDELRRVQFCLAEEGYGGTFLPEKIAATIAFAEEAATP